MLEDPGAACRLTPCFSSRCPEVALRRSGSGRRPVETPVSAGRGRGGTWKPAEPSPAVFPPPRQGLAANPSGYGPLTELPDWSFAGEP